VERRRQRQMCIRDRLYFEFKIPYQSESPQGE
jgi:hypothetical protein